MRTYFDTSIASKWYVLEADSPQAHALRRGCGDHSLILPPILRAELLSAWHCKVHRREIPAQRRDVALAQFADDVRRGVWRVPFVDLTAVFERTESLIERHAATLGSRTLDTLHVATAIECGVRDFATADPRQARLAQAAGLNVLPWEMA